MRLPSVRKVRERSHHVLSCRHGRWPVVIAAALVGFACATPQRWEVREQPTKAEAGLLLEQSDPQTIRREYFTTELPAIPVRVNLRPCCAFGSDIRVTLGPIPIPGYKIANILDVDDLGSHTYDSGYVHSPSQGAADGRLTLNRENNGLIYTCRGGFVDTAHVRDYIDWSLYVSSQIARAVLATEPVEFELPDEGGSRRIVVRALDPDLVRHIGPRRLSVWLAEWITFKMSIWHEIATWYGFASVPGFPEEASAFSPEDLYSNAIGVRLLPAIVYHRAERSELDFNGSVDPWLRQVIEFLGPVPREVAIEAAEAVDKLWWDSDARVPEKALVLRRNMDFEGTIFPWLVPPSRMPASLRDACGDAPEPQVLAAPESYAGVSFGDWVTLEIVVDDDIAKRDPFTKIGRRVTQGDFPTIVAAIRNQNRAEFGEDADRPD
jgi:hypothetical protein